MTSSFTRKIQLINFHHLLKYTFSICLCSVLISLSNVTNLLKMVIDLFSAYFGSHFCFHSNGKSQINTGLLHLGVCSNKLIRRNQ